MTFWLKYTPFKNYWLKKGPNHYHYHPCNHQFHQFHWFHYLHSFTLWPFLSSLLSSVSLGSILTLFYSVAFSIITTIISFTRFATYFRWPRWFYLVHFFHLFAIFTWFAVFTGLPIFTVLAVLTRFANFTRFTIGKLYSFMTFGVFNPCEGLV